MKKFLLSFILLSLCIFGTAQNNKFTVSGTIKDGESGEDLMYAKVYVKEDPTVGAVTNDYGFYSLSLPAGTYTIGFSYVGYDSKEEKIVLDKDVRLNLEVQPSGVELDGVTISAEKENENVTSTEMGVARFDPKEIENIPVLFGEKDIVKTIQLLPGVKSAGEGNSGYFVRGGGAGQNLILLDGAPVYNPSHLLGFFSVFNSDAIKDVKLYKGNMPAEYGGRLSSVMDIRMKEGNSKRFAFSGGIGLISSRLTVEGPIVKDKGSFMVSGRRTYADLFLKLSKNEDQRKTQLYFYDINAKANYKLGKKDHIYLSGYFGRDVFGFSDRFGFDWGNATGTLRWNHIFSDKLFSKTSAIYSDYNYKIKIGGDTDIEIGSAIRDINVKQDFDYFLNGKNTIHFGANVVHHTFTPGEFRTSEESGFNPIEIPKTYAFESSAYVSNEQKVLDQLSVHYGVRFSNFTQLGPGDIFSYDTKGNVVDTTTFKSGEAVKSYFGFAPRLAATYLLNEKMSLKTAYSRSYQYLHLLSNSTTSSPTDIWIPSSSNIKPQISDQVGLGYFLNLFDNQLELSVEVYYKAMQNAIDYKTGAQVTLNPIVEGELLFGKGRAYGIELFAKKRKGKFTGWISYTLARSELAFDEINDGKWYPAKQDRTHDVSIVVMYDVLKWMNLSATWIYNTGNAVTFPSGKYEIDGQILSYYTERNGYRMPPYHRMDLGITFRDKEFKYKTIKESGEKIKVPRKFRSSWNISIYNLYARENPYTISFRENEDDPSKTEAVQLSLFKIIPSFSYNFNF